MGEENGGMARRNPVKVTFLPMGRVAEVPAGSTVLEAIRSAGIWFESICGGRGECKKCRVIHVRGDCTAETPESTRGLSAGEIGQHVCLACRTILHGDCEFIIPVESRTEAPRILHGTCSIAGPRTLPVRKYLAGAGSNPLTLALGRPSISFADYSGRRPQFPSGWEERILSAGGPVTVTVSECGGYPEVVGMEEGDTTGRNYGVAIDIGTTTVVGMLLDIGGCAVLAQASGLNRQITYGEELVTRLAHSRDHQGQLELRLAATESINAVIRELAGSAGIEPAAIHEACIAGNTVMQYLFSGREARGLELADAAVDRKPYFRKARELGLGINPEACVWCLPNVSRFVGGDAVGDVLVSGMHRSDEISLLVDLGTNGEIILGNSEWLASVSCASGPAFEGAGISSGIRAMAGAIEHVSIDPVTGRASWKTIGDRKPKGICGSGIIDTAAAMAIAGICDFSGKLVEGKPGVRSGEEGLEYVLAGKEHTATGRDIVFTAHDMFYLMDSKAAACGATGVLLKKYRVRPGDVRHVYLAGAFGAYTDIGSITRFGILPCFRNAEYRQIGNGSLGGAAAALLSLERRQEAEEIARRMVYIDLLVDADFIEEYTAALYIPGKKEFFE